LEPGLPDLVERGRHQVSVVPWYWPPPAVRRPPHVTWRWAVRGKVVLVNGGEAAHEGDEMCPIVRIAPDDESARPPLVVVAVLVAPAVEVRPIYVAWHAARARPRRAARHAIGVLAIAVHDFSSEDRGYPR
jgi:hypothetical protein